MRCRQLDAVSCCSFCCCLSCVDPAPVAVGPSATQQGVSGANGVIVDADGVLRHAALSPIPTASSTKKRIAEARATSESRRGQAQQAAQGVAQSAGSGRARRSSTRTSPPTEEMQFLAGLTRVRYVFYYPETQGHRAGRSGRRLGRRCRRAACAASTAAGPSLQLQDLVVALRAFAPGERKSPVDSVLDRSHARRPGADAAILAQRRLARSRPDDTEMIVNGLRTNLGMQNIRVGGVAPNTHFAQVLLECDYRMKLIGIGLEKPPVQDGQLRRSGHARPATAARCSAGISFPTTTACAWRPTAWAWSWSATS